MTSRITIITGVLATALVVLFLGWLALRINSAPLWVVIAAGIAFIIADFRATLREHRGEG